MEYEVRITVKQEIYVPVEAENMSQAKDIAGINWRNNEYALKETHSRLLREEVTYEPLYPESRPLSISNSNLINLNTRKVSEPER